MQVPAELEELFVHFDKDCNGILDQEEIISLVQFLVDANSVVHQGLNLQSVSKTPLSVLSGEFCTLFPLLSSDEGCRGFANNKQLCLSRSRLNQNKTNSFDSIKDKQTNKYF